MFGVHHAICIQAELDGGVVLDDGAADDAFTAVGYRLVIFFFFLDEDHHIERFLRCFLGTVAVQLVSKPGDKTLQTVSLLLYRERRDNELVVVRLQEFQTRWDLRCWL